MLYCCANKGRKEGRRKEQPKTIQIYASGMAVVGVQHGYSRQHRTIGSFTTIAIFCVYCSN